MHGIRTFTRSLLLSLSLAATALAAPGDLDLTFGLSPGYTLTSKNNDNRIEDMLVDSAGRIVVSGVARTGTTYVPYLARYTAVGVLDTTFGAGGYVHPGPVANLIGVAGALVQIGSNVYVTQLGGDRVHVYAYMANGAPLTSFGTQGHAEFVVGTQIYGVHDMTVQSGKLLIALSARQPGSNVQSFVLARLGSLGALDGSFAGGGIAYTRIYNQAGAVNRFTSVALQSDGKIVAGGRAGASPDTQNFVIARFSANGVLDSAYNGNGFHERNLGGADLGRSVAVQTDGKILLAGVQCTNASSSDCQPRAIRTQTNGQADSTYGIAGVFAIDYDYNAFVGGMRLDSSGRALMVGSMTLLDGEQIAYITRLTSAGQLDSGFAGVGTKRLNFNNLSGAFANVLVALVPVGNAIYVGGYAGQTVSTEFYAQSALAKVLN